MNTDAVSSAMEKLGVLIDTWWNVNVDYVDNYLGGEISFNRYMVECEYFICSNIATRYTVLIDTWWNVNNIYVYEEAEKEIVLIDTWWNVNVLNLTDVTNADKF